LEIKKYVGKWNFFFAKIAFNEKSKLTQKLIKNKKQLNQYYFSFILKKNWLKRKWRKKNTTFTEKRFSQTFNQFYKFFLLILQPWRKTKNKIQKQSKFKREVKISSWSLQAHEMTFPHLNSFLYLYNNDYRLRVKSIYFTLDLIEVMLINLTTWLTKKIDLWVPLLIYLIRLLAVWSQEIFLNNFILIKKKLKHEQSHSIFYQASVVNTRLREFCRQNVKGIKNEQIRFCENNVTNTSCLMSLIYLISLWTTTSTAWLQQASCCCCIWVCVWVWWTGHRWWWTWLFCCLTIKLWIKVHKLTILLKCNRIIRTLILEYFFLHTYGCLF
jgi:hypothetical protein